MNEYLTVCIDDDEQFLRSLAEALPPRVKALCPDFACTFEFASSGEELFEMLGEGGDLAPLAMVISDQIMPGTDGIELIEKVKASHPEVVGVLLTGHAGLDSARYAINHHLLDQYVSKPIEDMQEFASTAANLLKRHHLDGEEKRRARELAQANEELRQSNERIRALQAAAESVAKLSKGIKRLDFAEVVDLIARDVPRIFNATRGVFCLVTKEGQVRMIRRTECPCPIEALEKRQDVQEGFASGQIRVNGISPLCEQMGCQPPEVLVPLQFADGSVGEGQGGWEGRGYFCLCTPGAGAGAAPEVLKYKAELLGEILSASLTNAVLYEQVKRDSETDPLTGLKTRRVLEERLQSEHARSRRYSRPCCLAILDVDNFKQINDAEGHVEGDETLRRLADILRRETRQTDILARYGGDEFVVLMPETAMPEAAAVAERIRKRAETNLAKSGRVVTVSCGLGTWQGIEGETATDLLRRADFALYRAKAAGRNRVNSERAA